MGYKTEQEASAAREWFDRSFIGSSRISVGVVEVHSFFILFSLLGVFVCSFSFSGGLLV